jgi:PAS domain S-box-containing protein
MSDPQSATDAHAAEPAELLRRLEARLSWLADRVGYGLYRSTPGGRFLEVNTALVSMLGYADASELLTLDLARDVYLDPEERDRLRLRPSGVAPTGWLETRWKRRDGTPITVRLSVRPVLDIAGEIESYEGIVDDVTERRRRDEILRRSERMASLGTTLAGVAHELNNPLAAIIGFTQLLLRRPWPEEDRAALETINHEALRSATIVKDLLAMTRTRDAERRAAVNLNDVVGYIARTRRYALETAGIALRLELDPALPPVRGDGDQLEQVLLNLLTNAEQALSETLENGTQASAAAVTIRTRREGADAIFEVEDNGPGVPEDARSRIWDPFWTTKEEGQGTGLGLSVAHSIVTDHGGTITIETSPAPGARFVVRLPIAADATASVATGQASRPLDVLIVDPGAFDLLFVERFLTSRGHAVINAGSGELALRLAEQTTFDAVVCDAQLLSREGAHVALALRSTSGCSAARFVLSVAEGADAPELRAAAAALHDAALVARPYDVEELRRLIEGD